MVPAGKFRAPPGTDGEKSKGIFTGHGPKITQSDGNTAET